MNAMPAPGRAAAWPAPTRDARQVADDSLDSLDSRDAHHAHEPYEPHGTPDTANPVEALALNRAWELDRTLMLERSERRAWWSAGAGMLLGLVGIAAVFVQGPLRRVVEIPIVVDRVTGETTIQQRLSVETVPPLEALDKHNLAAFVRAREGYSWMFLQRDYDQVARMAVPAVFADYGRQFDGDAALHKRLAAREEWRIQIVGVRLAATGRRGKHGNAGEATVTYDRIVRATGRSQPDATTRHVASIVYEYQPSALARERDRLENPFGFVVTAYRSDPEITTTLAGARP